MSPRRGYEGGDIDFVVDVRTCSWNCPGHAGQDVANALATVLSGAMLSSHLDEEAAANTVWVLVGNQLADEGPSHTPDLGGKSDTSNVVADLRDRRDKRAVEG